MEEYTHPAIIRQIIEEHGQEIAFIAGNGINRYCDTEPHAAWDKLLVELAGRISTGTFTDCPPGVTYTEFYDLMELEKDENTNLQEVVKELLMKWQPHPHHTRIAERIRDLNAPLLTTNFDENFARSLSCTKYKTDKENRETDYYPWTSYHGLEEHQYPTDGFGIWYINGMVHYHRSIRLGLCQYMGNVDRARKMIAGKERNLYQASTPENWKGAYTWLQLMFNKSLMIFGLSLDENEVFLRWLLLERKKYYQANPGKAKKGWFLCLPPNNPTDEEKKRYNGKKYFLGKVGFEVLELETYKHLYEDIWM